MKKIFLGLLFVLLSQSVHARYFDPEGGRFINRDPIEYIDGMNLYAGYFAQRFMIDPAGTTVKSPIVKGITTPTKVTVKSAKGALSKVLSGEDCDEAHKEREFFFNTTATNTPDGSARADAGAIGNDCMKLQFFIKIPNPCFVDGPGHVGIGIGFNMHGGRYYDIGPTAGNASPSTQWWDNPANYNGVQDPMVDHVKELVKKKYEAETAAKPDYVRVEMAVCNTEGLNVEQYWQDLYSKIKGGNAPPFTIPGFHCTSATCESIKLGNHFDPGTMGPGKFLKKLLSLKHKCGPNKGKYLKIDRMHSSDRPKDDFLIDAK